jgi:WhiB family redox-sensing transcriptional regulator
MGVNWRDQGLCGKVNPAVFFPPTYSAANVATAREWCASCPVRQQCATFAIRNGDQFGVFGGMTPAEREAARLEAGGTRRGGLRESEPCGTAAGYRRHKRRHQPACAPCLLAEAVRTATRKARRRELAGQKAMAVA